MFKNFHMNSWIYLLLIPIMYLFMKQIIATDHSFNLFLKIWPIYLISTLILVVCLYINNIIGLADMIILINLSISNFVGPIMQIGVYTTPITLITGFVLSLLLK